MRHPLRLALIAVFALVFLGGPSVLRFYTDWLWFGEVGYQQVFTTIVRSEASLFTMAFVVSVLWLLAQPPHPLGAGGEKRPSFTPPPGEGESRPGPHQLCTITSAISIEVRA